MVVFLQRRIILQMTTYIIRHVYNYCFDVIVVISRSSFGFMQLAIGGDTNAVRLTEEYDWYIVPCMNPDGYSYSWTNVRW